MSRRAWLLVVVILMAGAGRAEAEPPAWTEADKDGFGTAHSLNS